MTAIKENLDKYLSAQEDAKLASKQRDRYEHELLKHLNLHLTEQMMFISQGVQTLSLEQTQSKKQNALEELRDLVNKERSMWTEGIGSHEEAIQSYNNQNQLSVSKGNIAHFAQEAAPSLQLNQAERAQREAEEQENHSMTQVNKVRSQKVQELQDNNDQLFSELRKANEKYLDVRVENNKLKD